MAHISLGLPEAAPSPIFADTPHVLNSNAILDAIPDSAAVINSRGVIVAVNRAWRDFAVENGGDPDATGVGVSYLAITATASQTGCGEASLSHEDILAVLAGSSVSREVVYPCSGLDSERWFMMRVTPIESSPRGALITHCNITQRKAAESELEKMAATDPLTGLPNRRSLETALNSALSEMERKGGTEVGLLYIDLNGFKAINDMFGHAIGDKVLQEISQRIRRTLSSTTTIARLGGDEFAVLMTNASDDRVLECADTISRVLQEPITSHQCSLRVSASIGYCLAMEGEDAASFMDRADQQMYHKKRSHQEFVV